MAEREGVAAVKAPSGTVTFLFSDIEGSTQRWARDRAAMQDAVREHDRLMRQVIAVNGGHVFKTIGDAFCAAFARPESAAGAAVDAQRALAAGDFSAVDGLRVRMALNTGTADERDGDYFGPTLNRVARLLPLGHGGQVLLSTVTAELLQGALPAEATLTGLGEVVLKDLEGLERVYQLVAPGLRRDFPELRSQRASQPWLLPEAMRTQYFTGRDDLLVRIRQVLVERRRAALSGLGGVGKSQTALEYAARHRADYPAGVFWVGAETVSVLTSGFVEIVKALRLPAADSSDQDVAVKAAFAWFCARDGWLLILDNVDDRREVRRFVPERDQGHVLISSRESVFPELGIPRALDVGDLEAEDAVRFLLARVGRETASAEDLAAGAELARELGNLPLALEQAAAYIIETGASFDAYLAAYRKRRVALLEKAGGLVAHDTVAVTWAANFEAVQRSSPAAADVLRTSALLAPDAIPFELFLDGARALGEAIAEELSDPDDLAMTELLRPLARYSLVRTAPASRTFGVHRLVQEIVWSALAESDRRTHVERAIGALDAAFPDGAFATWERCERLVAHVTALSERLVSYDLDPETSVDVMNRAGRYLDERARYVEAQALHRRALAICERTLGPEDPLVATCLSCIAGVEMHTGRYVQAQALHERALAIRQRAFGPDHPDVAKSLTSIGSAYWSQDRYVEAQPLHERALAILERALGPDHTDVARVLISLSACYAERGLHAEALAPAQRALAIQERELGANHPIVAFSLNNIAYCLFCQDRFVEARTPAERALTIREKALGPNHPWVAHSLRILGDINSELGNLDEALTLHERSLAINERVLETDSPALLANLAGLAKVQARLGRSDIAQQHFERALALAERVLESNHPSVGALYHERASVLAELGSTGEAITLYERALTILERSLASEHPELVELRAALTALRAQE